MKRAVIYARYSTDLQNEKSVEDQIALCKRHAEKLGYTVVGSDFDRAKSGASTFGRPGLSRLMNAAGSGHFDVLIAEAPDRISRDIADLAGIHKALAFRSIEMQCVNGGLMDTLQIGMHGVIGQMQREEGAKKTRRGLEGVIRDGRSAGGRAYGYRPILGKAGHLEIIEAEATVIRRIFKSYAAGVAPRTIASALNKDGISPPRGARWNASTINGNAQRGYGILRNPLYAGKQIWNRVRMIKDPATGKRISRVNAASDWQSMNAPHLRIVDQTLFEQVAQRLKSVGGVHARQAPRAKRLLSGLLRCGGCGGAMSIAGADRSGPRIQCSAYKEAGSCSNSARYYVEKIERLVVDSLRTQLSDPDLIGEYVKAYREERNRAETSARRVRATLDRDHKAAKAEIQRIVSSIAKGLITDGEAADLLGPAREQLGRIESSLAMADSDTTVVDLHPQAVQRYKDNLESLAAVLARKGDTLDLDVVSTFRALVQSVVVRPRTAGEQYTVNITGYLASLMGLNPSALMVVAREGLEPPTPGL